MRVENLHEGQIIKNYKELCDILEIEPKKVMIQGQEKDIMKNLLDTLNMKSKVKNT